MTPLSHTNCCECHTQLDIKSGVCSLISHFMWFDDSSHKEIVQLVVIQIFSENRIDEEAVITPDQAGKTS
ncbi:unnamed protein product [Blumeria hordei]|uniref:Uncharacterized protein n=1 Tax=Blumeria hordei TaxID=2867405 RepID=A0A383ULD0_BLUHO|nr:unnamed protein product [Blumeria hordei]